MKLVKDDIVKMEWDMDLFLKNAHVGFLGAVHDYHGVGVAFQEGRVYALVGDDGALSPKELYNTLRGTYKITKGKNPTVEQEFDMDEYTEYTELVLGEDVIDSNVELAGLTDDDVVDILRRCEDLSDYFSMVLVG